LVQEVGTLWQAAETDGGGRWPAGILPDLPVQYADFAVWQRAWLQGGALASQEAYWRRQLAGAPTALALPADRPRPAAQSYRGANLTARFGRPLTERLRQLALAADATLYMVLLGGLQALLGRLAGQQDLIVGSPIANRERAEIEPLIGYFVNNLAMRADLSGDPSWSEWLGRCRRTALDAYAHQDLPFERLVEVLRPPRHLALTPLFQVVFAMQNTPQASVEMPHLRLQPLALTAKTARYDLEVHAWEREDEVPLLLPYSTDLFDAATVHRLVSHLEALLDAATADPRRRLSTLPLLAPGDTQQVLRARVDGQLPAPRPATGRSTRTPPRTAAEALLAALWRELLGVEDVAVEDHFFALGGHSLLATQLVFRLREAHSLDLPLKRLFERPTLEELAAALDAAEPG
jgi:non-ribosomal peptide synthetase component F